DSQSLGRRRQSLHREARTSGQIDRRRKRRFRSAMIYLLRGYMWLFVHRPFEVWPAIGELHVERIYMLGAIAVWALRKKQWVSNRLHPAFGFFTAVILLSWLFSQWPEAGRSVVEDYLKVGVFYVLLV